MGGIFILWRSSAVRVLILYHLSFIHYFHDDY
jgi:hypothetical protein